MHRKHKKLPKPALHCLSCTWINSFQLMKTTWCDKGLGKKSAVSVVNANRNGNELFVTFVSSCSERKLRKVLFFFSRFGYFSFSMSFKCKFLKRNFFTQYLSVTDYLIVKEGSFSLVNLKVNYIK